MAVGYFDGTDQPGRPGTDPSVPSLGTAFGTPDGQPNTNYNSGSPYFGMGGTLGSGYGPNTGIIPSDPSTSGGGFDWSQFQPASSTGGYQQANVSGGSTGYGGVFTAPTVEDFKKSDLNQFLIDQATKGTQASAFAKGLGNTAGTSKAIGLAGQNEALSQFQQYYQNALGTFNANANVGIANANAANQSASIWNQGQEFNAGQRATYDQNQFGNNYNLASLGLSAANSASGALGNYGTNSTNLATGYGNALGNFYNNQGATNAQGSAAQANIWSGLPGTLAGVGQAGLAAYGSGTPKPTVSPTGPTSAYTGYAGAADPYALFRK